MIGNQFMGSVKSGGAERNVIAIDGPSGAGKGTIARLVAQSLNYHLLDSGSLYRLTALAATQANCDMSDGDAVAIIAKHLNAEFQVTDSQTRIILGGDDVTELIRSEHVGMSASVVADYPPVRLALLARQRAYARAPGLVADGRDMGTVIFPDAAVKIFLTASAEERAKRRVKQLEGAGKLADLTVILADIRARDERDSGRAVAPLLAAEDALTVDSTSLSIDEVVSVVLRQVEKSALLAPNN